MRAGSGNQALSAESPSRMADDVYQFRPDVFKAVELAIPLICPAKKDVVTFFKGAGLRHSRLDDLALAVRWDRESLKKHEMTHELLAIANEDPSDVGLKVRREVLKRIVDFNNFESCWQRDQLSARGAVTKVRELVEEKDAFTRMTLAHDRERATRVAQSVRDAEERQRQAAKRESVKRDLYAVIVMTPGRARGVAFETVLNRLFALDGLLVRESFNLLDDDVAGIVEQIDGVIELDHHLYLVEAKFWSNTLGPGDVAQHMVRVAHRGEIRGVCIAHPGYSDAAVRSVKSELHRKVFVLATVEELVQVFETDVSIADWLRAKVHHAQIDQDPCRLYVPPHD
jgi:hypothetical protein